MKQIKIIIALLAVALLCNAQSKTILATSFPSNSAFSNSFTFGWGSNLKLMKELSFTAGLEITGCSISNCKWTDSYQNNLLWKDGFEMQFPFILSLQYNYPVVQMTKNRQLGVYVEPMLLYQPIQYGYLSTLEINDVSYFADVTNYSYNKFNWEFDLGVAYKYKRTREIQFGLYITNLDMLSAYRDFTLNGVKLNLPDNKPSVGLKLVFASDPF